MVTNWKQQFGGYTMVTDIGKRSPSVVGLFLRDSCLGGAVIW